MTNFERWNSFMSGFRSPQVYVDMGFYYLISAALQRRVFYGPDHSPLYTNQYVTLVGPPGVGKGLVLKQVASVLKELKLPSKQDHNGAEGVDRQIVEALAKIDYQEAENEESRGQEKKANYERPLLIPVAADATTYEALVSAMARCLRRKDYREYDKEVGKEITKIYTHSSIAFCLEELSSLLRRHADDVVQFLMVGYDCGDYKKDTKTQSVDRVQRMCINFLAGTTPSFMQRTFSDGLLNEGFSSRSLFIYASRNRHNDIDIPELTEEQQQHRKDVVEHVRKLASLYGKITLSQDARIYLQNWWNEQQYQRVNLSEKLVHFNARKDIHAKKMAAAVHFGESTEMEISIEAMMKATQVLSVIEKVMHHALVYNTNNPLYRPGTKILTYLEDKPDGATLKELLAKFWEDVETKQLEDILEHYIVIGKIATKSVNKMTQYVLVKETNI